MGAFPPDRLPARVKPILAVVRENRNPDLRIDEPDPEFWDRMRALEGTSLEVRSFSERDSALPV
jgi:hypothetical protein